MHFKREFRQLQGAKDRAAFLLIQSRTLEIIIASAGMWWGLCYMVSGALGGNVLFCGRAPWGMTSEQWMALPLIAFILSLVAASASFGGLYNLRAGMAALLTVFWGFVAAHYAATGSTGGFAMYSFEAMVELWIWGRIISLADERA